MKRVLLLSSEPPVKPKVMYLLSRNREEIGLQSHATTYTHLAIALDAENKSSEIFVDDRPFDMSGVYFRAWANYAAMSSALAVLLKNKKVPFTNSDVGTSGSDSKSYDYCKLFNHIRLPHTIIAYPEWLIINAAMLENRFQYPYILKASDGRQGYDNYLIKCKAELTKSLKGYKKNALFIVQEFIPNSFDYRIIIVGGKAMQAYTRTRDPKSSSHVNNASQGASKTVVNLTDIPKLCRLAEKAAKTLKREICGVDIIVSSESKKAYLVEVNSSPSLPYDTTVRLIQSYLTSTLK
ncbi:MAG: Ribosomal protein S6 modification protein [Microgenomates bacterium OLB23]|nr:MAG: Ribosomal protein S6 modification protein [Microgenomates bacterium OLB23]